MIGTKGAHLLETEDEVSWRQRVGFQISPHLKTCSRLAAMFVLSMALSVQVDRTQAFSD